jgi:hypothetical protein
MPTAMIWAVFVGFQAAAMAPIGPFSDCQVRPPSLLVARAPAMSGAIKRSVLFGSTRMVPMNDCPAWVLLGSQVFPPSVEAITPRCGEAR